MDYTTDYTRLMKQCPQWNTCSAADCPLDPRYLQRGGNFPDEEECRALRSTRLKIVAAAGATQVLRYGGLTEREWERKQEKVQMRFTALAENDRAQGPRLQRPTQGHRKRRTRVALALALLRPLPL